VAVTSDGPWVLTGHEILRLAFGVWSDAGERERARRVVEILPSLTYRLEIEEAGLGDCPPGASAGKNFVGFGEGCRSGGTLRRGSRRGRVVRVVQS